VSAGFKLVIPARLASRRLPEKPLRDVGGRPLIAHVWERACASRADEVLVATDDARIADVIERIGGQALLTLSEHATGTDRLAEVARRRGWDDDTVVVNLQGDEPLVPPELLDALASALANEPRAGIATAATPIGDPHELFSPHAVKVVLDAEGFALYFSRAPIPFARDHFAASSTPATSLPAEAPFLRHLGLYAYRAGTLRRLSEAPQAPLERAESLEQLRALFLGIRILVEVVPDAPPPGVDTEEDLERVRAVIARSSPRA
jgi:3-deoxy-manno-octulosonate cytidylyltransferase (CMP-KDO synthetase)